MRYFGILLGLSLPNLLNAAGGGIGSGFGADDWLGKWPVLLTILVLVVGMTGFLSTRILRRAKRKDKDT